MIKRDAVKREIVIHAKADQVWKAMTDPEELNRWYTTECEIDLRIGGRVKMVHGWGAWTEGTITELVEGERLVYSTGDDSETIVTLAPVEGGIKVSIEYRMPFIGDEGMGMSENMAFGTAQFLKNAKSVLETGRDLRDVFWPTWIGLSHTSVREDHRLEGACDGTLVLGTAPHSPAQSCGLKPGDVIFEANGKRVSSYEDLESIIWTVKPEEILLLKAFRNGSEKPFECRVAAHPRGEKVV